LITLRAELHVHTLLSPCAEVEMIPPLIISEALELGIDLIAITDHNASANIPAVMAAASGSGLTILPGIELQTREEVHSLCIFDTLEQVSAFQDLLDTSLPPLKNQPDFFGPQYVVDASGEFIREETRLLLTSSSLSLEEACNRVIEMGGLFIPAHVNRKANGLLATLGFIPPDLAASAIEISRHITPEAAKAQFPQLNRYPLIQSGDVHRLDDFLAPNYFTLESLCVAELSLALQGRSGRKLVIKSSL
jgi:PHP family Zn ribbon phosphoesterase